jgi:predicted MFS family arabinose efflux permease
MRVGLSIFVSFLTILMTVRFGMNEIQVGIFFSVVGLWMVIMQICAVGLMARMVSEERILIFSLPILGVCIAAITILPFLWQIYFIVPILALAMSLVNAVFPALIVQRSAPGQHGAALGVTGAIFSLSHTLAPIFVGLLTIWIPLKTTFIIGSLFICAAWFLVLLEQRLRKDLYH